MFRDQLGARRLGAARICQNISRHLVHHFTPDRTTGTNSYRPLIYCWRGGQRYRIPLPPSPHRTRGHHSVGRWIAHWRFCLIGATFHKLLQMPIAKRHPRLLLQKLFSLFRCGQPPSTIMGNLFCPTLMCYVCISFFEFDIFYKYFYDILPRSNW